MIRPTSMAVSARAVPVIAALAALVQPAAAQSPSAQSPSAYDVLVAKHAAANGVPESLVRRIIVRESRYNPRIVSRGNYGLMQIKPATARAMGYSGSAAGLLDADTNMAYAVKYLAGAYRVAGGNADRAVGYYARGYYDAAKRQGGAGLLRDNRLAAFGSVPRGGPTAVTGGIASPRAADAVRATVVKVSSTARQHTADAVW